ncbi:MAG: glycosyltransferase [Phycisphaeraceae bacterium]|nr:MAG: glycosyltransferase [Phycisphaeraceae bacterium]
MNDRNGTTTAARLLDDIRDEVLTEWAAGVTRMDAHCHSWASDGAAAAALGFIGCPECYSPPEKVYDQAMARGMDLVTITDHDTIKGAMELVERRFERFVVGQEVSVRFPEDRCLLHVLVWGLTPELDEQIDKLDLRSDVYDFAAWLRERNLAHAFAHPLYVQNGRLTRWHVERAALLFKGFECLNGAHAATMSDSVVRFINGLTPARIADLSVQHNLDPIWPRMWEKARTGGSDDHGLLNIGRTWTQVGGGKKIADPREFLRRVMAGESVQGGAGGHSALLAHQFATVGAHYYTDRLHDRQTPTGKYISARLLRFAGIAADTPSKKRVGAYKIARKMWLGKKAPKPLPVLRSLKRSMNEVLVHYPRIAERLRPEAWDSGAPLSEHEDMADFVQDLSAALSRAMGPGAIKAIRKRDPAGIAEHLVSYGILHLAQLPYLFSLFHQNKERNFLEQFEHEISAPGSGVSVLERPMRVSLFTDTFYDVNGVCRFIQNVAERAHESGRDLEVITSTNKPGQTLPNVYNFAPVFAMKLPKYDNLDMCLPPVMKILRHLDQHQPDVIHISTPGPVGCVGFLAAKMLRIPVLGVYHTDFPAYIDRLFDDYGMTTMCEKFMRFFYKPFSAIFTRSDDYVDSLANLGLPRERVVSLMPGFDASVFHSKHRDPEIWRRLGLSEDSVKVLYVGRVSVEKNMPFLVGVWKAVRKRLKEMAKDGEGVKAELVVVGDGPFREKMESELGKKGASFLGFRHGEELSAIYASSHMFVFPSTTDTLGQVVMESQGSGLPVVVTDKGGPKEVVEHGRTGFVLGSTDADAWVEHVVTLITDHARRADMGIAAHESMQRYGLEHSFEHFWDVHKDAWHEHLGRLGVTRATAGSAGGKSPGEADESSESETAPVEAAG